MKTNGLPERVYKGDKATYSNLCSAKVLVNSAAPLVMHTMSGQGSCYVCVFITDLAREFPRCLKKSDFSQSELFGRKRSNRFGDQAGCEHAAREACLTTWP